MLGWKSHLKTSRSLEITSQGVEHIDGTPQTRPASNRINWCIIRGQGPHGSDFTHDYELAYFPRNSSLIVKSQIVRQMQKDFNKREILSAAKPARTVCRCLIYGGRFNVI